MQVGGKRQLALQGVNGGSLPIAGCQRPAARVRQDLSGRRRTFPVNLMERWQRATRLEIYDGYGMSEIAPISGTTALTGVRPGSVGKPVPGNDVPIVHLE